MTGGREETTGGGPTQAPAITRTATCKTCNFLFQLFNQYLKNEQVKKQTPISEPF
jgi:hypothetical protein